jgi:hypothetical protein
MSDYVRTLFRTTGWGWALLGVICVGNGIGLLVEAATGPDTFYLVPGVLVTVVVGPWCLHRADRLARGQVRSRPW